MPAPLSAVDSVSPAFADARRILFAPWSLAMWSRMAVLGLLTGEFASGGWSGSSNINVPQNNRRFSALLVNPPFSPAYSDWLRQNWQWFALCGVLLIALFLLAEYLSSVSRFVLLESVITGKCELRGGWKRWRGKGLEYFGWNVGFAFFCLAVLLLVIGVPVWTAIRRAPSLAHFSIASLLAAGAAMIITALLFLIVAAVINLFARDFVVPIMAVENRGVFSAWRRFLAMLAGEKLAYTGYVLMKIVLAVGSAILFGVIDLIAFFLLLIPMGIIGVFIYLSVRHANLSWNFTTISLIVIGAALVVAIILWVFAFLYSPALVFFQSYALRFLSSRLPSLYALMNPPPAAAAPPIGDFGAAPSS